MTAVEPESVEVEEGAVSEALPYVIAASAEAMLPEILAEDEPDLTLTPAQWQEVRKELAYLVQALQKAQTEISRLKAECDTKDTECLALHAQNGDLNNEIAHLKAELASLKQQSC